MTQTAEAPPPGPADDAAGNETAPEEAAPEVIHVAAPARSGRRGLLAAGVGAAALVVGAGGGFIVGRASGGTGYDAAAGDPHHPSFTYDGETGPDHWGELSPLTEVCGRGNLQSPVDITPRKLHQVDWLEPLKIEYKATPTRLLHTGYTFQVNYDPGSKLTFLGAEYEVVQFHFHTPSEHLVNGRPADMELHVVHARKGAPNFLAVLGVLISAGAENPLLAKFWQAMPEKPSKETKAGGSLNVADALPANRDYWTYSGSLTTPPCTERVTWLLLKESIQASRGQIGRFTEVFGKNARPVQPLGDRFVMEKLQPTA
jgi:carbonic anhydrase